MKQTVFKKVMVTDRLPDYTGEYITNIGIRSFSVISECFILEYGIEYWLEEIELPSEEDVFKDLTHEVYLSKTLQESTKAIYKFAVSKTTDYILNKLS